MVIKSTLSYGALLAQYLDQKGKLIKECRRSNLLTTETTIQNQVIHQLKRLLNSSQTKPTCMLGHKHCEINHGRYNLVNCQPRNEFKTTSSNNENKVPAPKLDKKMRFIIKMTRGINKLQSKYGLPASQRVITADHFIHEELVTIWDNALSFKGNVKEAVADTDSKLMSTCKQKSRHAPRLRTIPILYYPSKPSKPKYASKPSKNISVTMPSSKLSISSNTSSGYDETSVDEYGSDAESFQTDQDVAKNTYDENVANQATEFDSYGVSDDGYLYDDFGGISYYIEEDAYKKEALEAAYNEIMDLHKVECADDQTYPICYNGYSSNGTEFCEAQSLDSGDTAECSSYQDLGSDYYVGSASDQLVSEVVGNNVGLLCLADMPYEEPSYAPDPPD